MFVMKGAAEQTASQNGTAPGPVQEGDVEEHEEFYDAEQELRVVSQYADCIHCICSTPQYSTYYIQAFGMHIYVSHTMS